MKLARPRSAADGRGASKATSFAPVVIVTGTDTGVGKTVASCLVVRFLRASGVDALAVKPFATGNYDDAERLRRAQDGRLTQDEITPFFFLRPVAPWVAANESDDQVPWERVMAHLQAVRQRCEGLVIEGCGGLLTPLGPRYTLADVVATLESPVILVAANKLGVLNHTLLTLEALKRRGVNRVGVMLMDLGLTDASTALNRASIKALAGPSVVVEVVPFLRLEPGLGAIPGGVQKKIQKLVAQIWGSGRFLTVTSARRSANDRESTKKVDKSC
jgi:dethiobiotin synthetase